MLGLSRAALTSALVMTLSGCSTQPSPPKTVVTRDVTAICPAPIVRIDRGFAVEPPRCVETLTPFRYGDASKWIQALADGTGEIATQSACLSEMHDWLASERVARSLTGQELTQ